MDWHIYHDSAFAIKWREPQRFKWLRARAELGETGLAFFFVKVLAFCCGLLTFACLLAWFFARLDPAKEPLSLVRILLLAAAASVFMAIFSLTAAVVDARFLPRTLVLARNWMGVIWEAQPRWRYTEIANIRFGKKRLGEEEFRVMVVTSRHGRESTLALSAKVDPQKVTELLRSKGVEIAEDV